MVCNLAQGSARQEDSSALTFALMLRVADLGTRVWWEHVQGVSNVADGGSRVGVDDPTAAALGIGLRQQAFPPLPQGFGEAPPSIWLRFWEGE